MTTQRKWIVLSRIYMALDNREFMEGTLAKECVIYGQRHGVTEAEVTEVLNMNLGDLATEILAAPLDDTNLSILGRNV